MSLLVSNARFAVALLWYSAEINWCGVGRSMVETMVNDVESLVESIN